MRFGDVITAVASLAVIMALIEFPLFTLLVPALGFYWGLNVGAIISVLISALIGGYVFAKKIWEEARIKAIAKITVFGTFLIIFNIAIAAAALADWTPMVKQAYLEANPSATPSAFEWYVIESMFLSSQVFLNVVIVLVLGFIGLYIGSMFKRPAKS